MTSAELNKLTLEELRALNAQVIDIIKRRNKINCMNAVSNFAKGQKVKFESRKLGGLITGTVVSTKVKNVVVDCGIHGRWNVAGSLLKSA